MTGVLSLLRSRKVLVALCAAIGVFLVEIGGVDPEAVVRIEAALVTLALAIIGGIAWEDSSEKRANGGKE